MPFGWLKAKGDRADLDSVPAEGFADIHSHVIPDVDDGPKTWDDAMAILERAAQGGTRLMIATPHGDTRARWKDTKVLTGSCHALNEALRQKGIPLTIVLGMENPLEPRLPERVQKGSALAMNGSPYVLVELPYTQLPLYWEEVLFQLQLRGKRPIIAHPERQSQIQEDPTLLAGPVSRGVLAQLTAASLTPVFGPRVRKAAEELLKRDFVHFIASDTHAAEGPRGPDILPGFHAAVKVVGRDRAVELAVRNPRAVALGKDLLSV